MTLECYHPIIYVRGFAMRDSEIEATVNTPYMGFNLGATRVRQGPSGEFNSLIFESPVIRLMKDHGYRDVYAEGAEREDRLPRRTLLIHRYYEGEGGEGQRPSIPEAARALSERILWLRERICGDDEEALAAFKVYLVAHSMGGLVCRCLLQNPEAGSAEARACVDKVFTYGTPPRWHRDGRAQRAALSGPVGHQQLQPQEHRRLPQAFPARGPGQPPGGGHFPPERFFCLVGTNHRDYNATRHVVGSRSDGLVKIDCAWVEDAPRVHLYLAHSGPFGMVNSEAGYLNLTRFLFGDARMLGRMVVEHLPLPPSLQQARDEGREIEGSYHFECTVMPRLYLHIDPWQ